MGKRRVFLVEGRMGANKHRQIAIGNCRGRRINISMDCRFARIHKREKEIKMAKQIWMNQWNLKFVI